MSNSLHKQSTYLHDDLALRDVPNRLACTMTCS
jgi:hypothetical protein